MPPMPTIWLGQDQKVWGKSCRNVSGYLFCFMLRQVGFLVETSVQSHRFGKIGKVARRIDLRGGPRGCRPLFQLLRI